MGIFQVISVLLLAGCVYGQCPKLEKDTVGACVEGCGPDKPCGFNEICCSNGCGKECFLKRCPSGTFELPNWNCGRGGTRCPGGYSCNSDPVDRFAVCCSDSCKDIKCAADEHCELLPTPCRPESAPCPPAPVCIKNTINPCAVMLCMVGTVCEVQTVGGKQVGVCVPVDDPCEDKKCEEGERCDVVVNPCLVAPCPREAVCVKITPCNGQCGPDEFCDPPDEFCADCVATCRGKVCSQPKKEGPCEAAIDRFYYDPNSQVCREFKWGGCDSNGNNFENVEDCRKLCRAHDPCEKCAADQVCELQFVVCVRSPCPPIVTCRGRTICELPKVEGPCRDSFPRYFFNSKTNRCEKFIYGGCGGNKNNFTRKRQCLRAARRCRRRRARRPARRPARRGQSQESSDTDEDDEE